MNESLERRVRKRAGDRSEYCKFPALITDFTFPLDHIIAQQHGGERCMKTLPYPARTTISTKVRTSPGSILKRAGSQNSSIPVAKDGASTSDGTGPRLVGMTACGRTTVSVLRMNHPDRMELRRLLIEAGLFPP